ncbi:MAG: fused response regulator/phosphatase [bacterium]
MNTILKALIIEDSECDALLMLAHLRHGGYEPQFLRVDNAADLAAALNGQKWDIVFSDHNMPHFNSTEALEIVRSSDADIPFLIVSGSIGEDLAVAAMKAGAQDYLMKGNLTRLVGAVDRELKDAADRRARRVAERTLLAREEELRIAREVQQLLFPTSMPLLAGYDMAGASCPAEATGGDYFDFIACPGLDVYVVVGDVTGHGLGPALLMTDVRAYLRALVLADRPIVDLMTRARHLLVEDLGSDRFITMLIARLTPSEGLLDVINAGHPSGYILAPDGGIKGELNATAPALGIDSEAERLVSSKVRMDPGDLAVFLTDGILEAASPDGEEFGMTRVIDILQRERKRPAVEMIRILFDEVRRFGSPEGLQDDVTAVIIKRQG